MFHGKCLWLKSFNHPTKVATAKTTVVIFLANIPTLSVVQHQLLHYQDEFGHYVRVIGFDTQVQKYTWQEPFTGMSVDTFFFHNRHHGISKWWTNDERTYKSATHRSASVGQRYVTNVSDSATGMGDEADSGRPRSSQVSIVKPSPTALLQATLSLDFISNRLFLQATPDEESNWGHAKRPPISYQAWADVKR